MQDAEALVLPGVALRCLPVFPRRGGEVRKGFVVNVRLQKAPVASPNRRRNQPLTEAISGTRQMDWVRDSSRLKVRRKCQGCRTRPNKPILPPYSRPPASMRHRAP